MLCSGLQYGIITPAAAWCASLRKVQLAPRTFQLLARVATRQPEQRSYFGSKCARQSSLPWTYPKPRQRASIKPGKLRDPGSRQPATRTQSTVANDASEDHEADPSADAEEVKLLMRLVPHAVAIITAADTGVVPEGGSPSWRGATVSSFNTVTLTPTPVVSFNIKKLSSTFDAIKHSGQFAVHLLNDMPEAIQLATAFAKGNAASPFAEADDMEAEIVQSEKRSKRRAAEPPLLEVQNEAGQPSVAFVFQCEFMSEKTVGIGDHVVIFGRVTRTSSRKSDKDSPQTCLAYVDGHYSNAGFK